MKSAVKYILIILCMSVLILSSCAPAQETEVPQEAEVEEVVQEEPETEKDYTGVTFVIYSYGGAWDEAITEAAVNPLKAAHPGLEVIVAPDGGFDKLLGEKDDPQADISFVDDSTMAAAVAGGLIQELDTSKISNWDDIYAEGKKYGNYGAAMEFGRFGICYRTDLVKEPPDSWADLWDPDYAGRVSVGAASAAGTAWVQFLDAAARLNGGDYNDMDKGFEKLAELAPNLLTVTESTGQINQLLTDGEIYLTHFWDGRCIALKRMGVPVEFVAPKEGAYSTITYVGMVSGTEYPELAYEFIDYILAPEGQLAWGKLIGYGPTNSKAVVPQEWIDEGVIYGEEAVKAMINLPWPDLIDKRSEWLEKWNAAVR